MFLPQPHHFTGQMGRSEYAPARPPLADDWDNLPSPEAATQQTTEITPDGGLEQTEVIVTPEQTIRKSNKRWHLDPETGKKTARKWYWGPGLSDEEQLMYDKAAGTVLPPNIQQYLSATAQTKALNPQQDFRPLEREYAEVQQAVHQNVGLAASEDVNEVVTNFNKTGDTRQSNDWVKDPKSVHLHPNLEWDDGFGQVVWYDSSGEGSSVAYADSGGNPIDSPTHVAPDGMKVANPVFIRDPRDLRDRVQDFLAINADDHLPKEAARLSAEMLEDIGNVQYDDRPYAGDSSDIYRRYAELHQQMIKHGREQRGMQPTSESEDALRKIIEAAQGLSNR